MTTDATSQSVLAVVANKLWRSPAHAWLYEVRSKTGFGNGQERFADALVVSLWPSRGIWVAGVEVKVSRQDWVHELDQPAKSAPIQRYCDFWYVAATEGVVREGEVPESWGQVVVTGGKAKVHKVAPKLDPEPWDRAFAASVLRNASNDQNKQRRSGFDEGYAKARDLYFSQTDGELREKLAESERLRIIAEKQLEVAKSDLESLQHSVATFEQVAGLDPGAVSVARWDVARRTAAHSRMAELLRQHRLGELADKFRVVANALAAVVDVVDDANGNKAEVTK